MNRLVWVLTGRQAALREGDSEQCEDFVASFAAHRSVLTEKSVPPALVYERGAHTLHMSPFLFWQPMSESLPGSLHVQAACSDVSSRAEVLTEESVCPALVYERGAYTLHVRPSGPHRPGCLLSGCQTICACACSLQCYDQQS